MAGDSSKVRINMLHPEDSTWPDRKELRTWTSRPTESSGGAAMIPDHPTFESRYKLRKQDGEKMKKTYDEGDLSGLPTTIT
ncbi:MAG: hypothetical protein Q9192_003524 [Flavoplaca navasiana]